MNASSILKSIVMCVLFYYGMFTVFVFFLKLPIYIKKDFHFFQDFNRPNSIQFNIAIRYNDSFETK
jgi:hypothetical protein